MRKYLMMLCAVGACLLLFQSCSDYLDQSPESGLSEKDIFTKFDNFKKYFESVYAISGASDAESRPSLKNGYPFFAGCWARKYTWDSMTDIVDQPIGYPVNGRSIKQGDMGEGRLVDFVSGIRPILHGGFSVIRLCNNALEHIDDLKDASENDKADLRGQIHFARAYAHFSIFRFWGGIPYLDRLLGENDDWDVERLSDYETLQHIAADFQTAADYFEQAHVMRRDALPGQPGHLDNPNLYKPNGVAALAFKGRVLLYAASPKYNSKGVDDWKTAADANLKALQAAEKYGYSLLPFSNYTDNYYGAYYTDESLWSYNFSTGVTYGATWVQSIYCAVFTNDKTYRASACPTQNLVDRFETKWGDPLNTETDRAAATQVGHYNDQNPYADRDPRFGANIIYNQAPIPGYTQADIWYDPATKKYGTLLDHAFSRGWSHTGYYQRKYWGGQSPKNNVKPVMSEPLIRLAEVYLNYAEAANEAYGPTAPAPGSSLSAVQAVNIVRTRATMPGVQAQFTTSTDVFRPRIKNERIIELCFEGHQYFDLRRWKDAPEVYSSPLYGMNIEKVEPSAAYPTGFRYTRVKLDDMTQLKWKDEMYYFPFMSSDMEKMSKFKPNPTW